MAIQKWIGEGINPTIKESSDRDILRKILEILRNKKELGLFTFFVGIKWHRGDFFDELVDRWADKGRDMETEARWTDIRQRPIFTWTASGIAHRSTMTRVVKYWAHLMAARLQIHEHDNLTARWQISEPEKGTAGRSLGITGRTNELISEPSTTSFKALASSSRAPRILRNRAGRRPPGGRMLTMEVPLPRAACLLGMLRAYTRLL